MTGRVKEVMADVHTLHHLGPPYPAVRMLRWCVPTNSAIVLGSTQPEADVDTAAAEALRIDIVRRRSGGGAVLVEPGDTVWADVFFPVDDRHWQPDVAEAFAVIGSLWVGALARLGLTAHANGTAMIANAWSKQICFAGLGPGEVLVGDQKVVGVSQRRTREGALFQCSLYRHFRTERLDRLMPTDGGAEHLRGWVYELACPEAEIREAFTAEFQTLSE